AAAQPDQSGAAGSTVVPDSAAASESASAAGSKDRPHQPFRPGDPRLRGAGGPTPANSKPKVFSDSSTSMQQDQQLRVNSFGSATGFSLPSPPSGSSLLDELGGGRRPIEYSLNTSPSLSKEAPPSATSSGTGSERLGSRSGLAPLLSGSGAPLGGPLTFKALGQSRSGEFSSASSSSSFATGSKTKAQPLDREQAAAGITSGKTQR
ncbi:unnamed protein product, partial [Amoebophrya sp. A120]